MYPSITGGVPKEESGISVPAINDFATWLVPVFG